MTTLLHISTTRTETITKKKTLEALKYFPPYKIRHFHFAWNSSICSEYPHLKALQHSWRYIPYNRSASAISQHVLEPKNSPLESFRLQFHESRRGKIRHTYPKVCKRGSIFAITIGKLDSQISLQRCADFRSVFLHFILVLNLPVGLVQCLGRICENRPQINRLRCSVVNIMFKIKCHIVQ